MTRASSHLLTMLLVTAFVTVLGAAHKAPCASATYVETGSAPMFGCYSDLSALYRFEQLEHGRIPYLDACLPAERPCDEYPAGTMVVMWFAAATGGHLAGFPGFYAANVLLMLGCALVTAWALERMRARTILFAAAPGLALYGTLNWDLFPVAAATAATLWFLRGRDIRAGIAFGVGTAAKLFPAFLLIPFGSESLRRGDRAQLYRVVTSAGVVALLVNLPFAIAAPNGWLSFFRYNRVRVADYESLWTALCTVRICLGPGFINVAAIAITVGATAWIWARVAARHADLPRWMMGFPLLVVLICANKFWSPQFGLWVLPWFALSRIPVRAWFAYQVSEILEFLVRTAFFSAGVASGVVPLRLLALVVAVRAAMLIRCLVLWMRDPYPVADVGVPEGPVAVAA